MSRQFAGTTNKREDQMQFLRFFAFLNVFVLHIGQWRFIYYPAWNAAVSAVTFFFMLSGMLAGFNAYGKEINVSMGSICKDMWKKIQKIYPLYFLTTFFSVLYFGVPAAIVHDLKNSVDQLIQLARNILLIQSWFPEGHFSYNGVSWYLSTLLFLYLLTIPMQAFLIRIGKKEKHNVFFALLIGILFFATAGYSYITYTSNAHFLQYIFPPARIGQYFIAMIAGYMLRERKERATEWKTGIFTIGEVLALIFWVYTLRQPIEVWYNRLVLWIFPNLCLIGVFLLGQGWLSKLFRLRPFVRLGDISFECYLLHECIIYSLIKVEPYTNWGRLVCIGFALGYTLLMAFFINGRTRKPMGR